MFHPQGPTFRELAREALSSTRRGYDLLAPKFDYTPFRTPELILEAAAERIGPPGSVDAGLDLCCGTGAALRVLRPLCRRRVVGVDFSENMLRAGRAAADLAPGNARLELVQADVLQLPFGAHFDLAVCFGALGHILPRHQTRFVQQVAQVLVPGGRFVFASCDRPPRLSRRYWLSHGFNAAMRLRNLLVSPPFIMYYLTFLVPQARRLLETAGFTVERFDRTFPQPYADACLVVATLQRGQSDERP